MHYPPLDPAYSSFAAAAAAAAVVSQIAVVRPVPNQAAVDEKQSCGEYYCIFLNVDYLDSPSICATVYALRFYRVR